MSIASKRIVIWVLFIAYLAVLVKVIMFKHPLAYTLEAIRNNSWEGLDRRLGLSNLTPGKTITFYLYRSSGRIGPAISRINLLANLLAFVPLGAFLPALFTRPWGAVFIPLAALGLSLAFETTQLLLGIGSFDIDDLILNTLGAIIGYLAFALSRYIWQRRGSPVLNGVSKL